jgi:hypothetical protein
LDDEQIELLKDMLRAGHRLAVCFGREYREILSIELRKETHEGPEGLEPAGVFANGEYAALWAANPEDIVRFEVTPVFEFDGEE